MSKTPPSIWWASLPGWCLSSAVASNSPEVNQYHQKTVERHWQQLHGDLEKTKQHYDDHLAWETNLLDQREANINCCQQKLDDKTQKWVKNCKHTIHSMDSFTTRAKITMLLNHVKNALYRHRTGIQTKPINWTRMQQTVKSKSRNYMNSMNLLQTEKEWLQNILVECNWQHDKQVDGCR